MSLICYTYKLDLLLLLAVVSLIDVSVSLIDGQTTRALPSCPSSCFCDDDGVYVSCVSDAVWDFETPIPNSTVRLEIRNYMIGTLSPTHLDRISHLQELKLQQTKIEFIANGTFNNVNKLQRLDLSENQIEILTPLTFEGLNNSLHYLDMSSNYLTSIDGAFCKLENVEQLNLRGNRLSYLTINTFLGMVKVQYLNLDLNVIKSIEYGTFIHLPHLAHLILSNNPLSQLSRIDSVGTRLQYIDISNIGVNHVPHGLPQFVKDLRMARNNITKINAEDFNNYPYLSLLVLDDNRVEEIESDALGRLQYLVRLWINGNSLKAIPSDLPSGLKELYIEENQIESIEAPALRGMYNLERLFLQRNQIRYLEKSVFSDMINLQSLDLHANRIENLTDEVFANLTKLEILDLSQNNLHLLEGRCFIDLQRLKVLHMSRIGTDVVISENSFDPLKSIQTLEMYDSVNLSRAILNSSRSLHSLRSLQEINIMQNAFVNLRSDIPSFFPQMKAIKMSGNKWHCDRGILWLTHWLRTSTIQFHRSFSIRCMSPEHLKFKPIALLTENDLSMPTISAEPVFGSTKMQSSNGSAIKSSIVSVDSLGSLVTQAVVPITEQLQEPWQSANPVNKLQVQNQFSALIKQPNFTESPKLSDTLTVPISATDITSIPSISIPSTSIPSTSIPSTSIPKIVPTPLESNILLTVDEMKSAHTNTHTNIMTRNLPKLTSPNIASLHSTEEATKVGSNISVSISSTESPSAAADGISPHKLLLPLYTIMTDRERHYDTSTVTKYHHMSSPAAPIDPFHHNIHFIHGKKISQNEFTSFVLTVSLLVCFSLMLAAIGLSFVFYKYRRPCPSHCKSMAKRCRHQRSNSLQYFPQNDEVSILTVTEGAVRLRTDTHHGLGNKLYFAINGDATMDITKQAIPDNDFEEYLPQENGDRTTKW